MFFMEAIFTVVFGIHKKTFHTINVIYYPINLIYLYNTVVMIRPWILAMDLDGTVWDHLNISGVEPPYTRVNASSIKNRDNVVITLFNEAITFIKWARSNGAIITTLSWNRRDYVEEALETFGISELFDYNSTDHTPDKDQRLLKLIKTLNGNGVHIPVDRVVYVDDRDIHMEEIKKNVGSIVFINIWKSAKNYRDAMAIVKEKILEPDITSL
jgi:magnesium-dependent phosphatase-1